MRDLVRSDLGYVLGGLVGVLVTVLVLVTCDALLTGCVPRTPAQDLQRVVDDQRAIDDCKTVSRAAYRDAGREAGLGAFDDCTKEGGL